jgi:DNA replication protein DnaC
MCPSLATDAPRRIGNFLAGGHGPIVSVEGTVQCLTCKRKVKVKFRGPEDSLGVRMARGALLNGTKCGPCIEREDADEERAQLAAHAETIRARRIERANVPERWRPVTFERLRAKTDKGQLPAIEAAEEWAATKTARGLLLWGAVGRGKTVVAAGAANARTHHGDVRWLSVAELMLHLRMPFETPEYKGALRALDARSTRAALVLDDLDKLKPTEHSLQPLYVGINGWLEKSLPLLVTMNRSPGELSAWMGETFGEALGSRLVGYCNVVEVCGRDRRLS